MPIGSYAELKDGELWLRALVGAPDGSQLVRGERRGPAEQAEALGISLAEELLDNGAREILAAVYDGEARDEHLVTRPLPQGEALVSRLRAMGRVARSFPLIEFTPGRELPALGDALPTGADDLLFALSQHAVEFAHARLQQQGLPWPTSPRYFAIGRTTALALHTVSGQHIHYPLDREISEVLLQLPELQNIAGKNALILRGNGGRELLGATLTERGARVTFCECYQRSAKHYDGAEEAMRWQSRGVTTLVVTSGEMLQQLWSLIPQWYREQWLLHCRVVVVSERLALQARELGWQEIQVADSADNDALLRALQ